MRVGLTHLYPVNAPLGAGPGREDIPAAGATRTAGAPAPIAQAFAGGPPITALNPETLSAALMAIGLTADKENLALAELFARLGVPLTEANITQARTILARYSGTPPTAFALAKTIDMEPSAAVLRALSLVVDGLPEGKTLPPEIQQYLGMALDAQQPRDMLAAQLKGILTSLGRSTEAQILQASTEGGALGEDLRSVLMNLVQMSESRAVRMAADNHAAFIEGQQLLNQIALLRFDPPVPLYFAFGALLGNAQPSLVEVQVWTHDEESAPREDDDQKPYMRTVIRVAPPRLGMVETRLTGTRAGSLRCDLAAEKPATYRLLKREANDLAMGLSRIGWEVRGLTVQHQQQFVPLWYGGDALSSPRTRVDRQV